MTNICLSAVQTFCNFWPFI